MSDQTLGPVKLDLSSVKNAVTSAGETLVFDQSAVKDAVQACTDLLDVLKDATSWSAHLDKIEGMDKFGSAAALSNGLGSRAGETPGGFRQALNEHKATVEALREAIEKAGKGYVDTDGKVKTDFTSLNTNPSAGVGLPDHMVTERDVSSPPPAPPAPKPKTTGGQAGGPVGWTG